MTATWIAFILYAAAAIALGWSAYRRQVIATARAGYVVGLGKD